jgi:YesN/AraC family two-component response regulator
MLKVFLVEDEIVMREGIKNNIEWEKEGYQFAGEASDGELAFPMIKEIKPDILITDIKMPFMDGLELSRLVKKEIPNIKIIILSGYDEFEYAKEAIKIGVTDYLLKPMSGAKLLEAVNKVGETILAEREQQNFMETYEKERQESLIISKRNLFRLMSRKEMEDAAERMIDLLQIKTPSSDATVGSLSGGNQQKVIIGRWLITNPDYLILDEPTRGIDIGTKTEIQKLVIQLADEGKAVTFISSEIEEMLRTCTRMAVLRDGEKVGELSGGEMTQGSIMKTIAGNEGKKERRRQNMNKQNSLA